MLKAALYFTAGLLVFCGVRRMMSGPKPQVVASGGRSFDGKRRQGPAASAGECPPAMDKQEHKHPVEHPAQATAEAAAVFEPGDAGKDSK